MELTAVNSTFDAADAGSVAVGHCLCDSAETGIATGDILSRCHRLP